MIGVRELRVCLCVLHTCVCELLTCVSVCVCVSALAGGCAVMSTAKPLGKWVVKNCTMFKAGSICKRDIAAPQPLVPEPDPNLPCPDGWTSRPGISYCYKVCVGLCVSVK